MSRGCRHDASRCEDLAVWLVPGATPPRLPTTDDEWAALARGMIGEGLCGLVLERCAVAGVALPQSIEALLRHHATLTAANNLHVLRVLEELLPHLHAARIDAMLLKGAALNLTLYERRDLRPMSDLDLLVRPADALGACAVLERAGCRTGRALVHERFFPEFHHETELFAGGHAPVRIDLHAHPLRPARMTRRMPADALWCNARVIPVGSRTAPVPATTEMLVHLAAHAAVHGCDRLIWLYDIRRLVDTAALHGGVDWEGVAGVARAWNLTTAVTTALRETERRLPGTVPPDVQRAVFPHRGSWRDRLVLWSAPREARRPGLGLLVHLLCTPGVGYRIRYVAVMLRPARAHLEELYPWRHFGWVACAHAWRWIRGLLRLPAFVRFLVPASRGADGSTHRAVHAGGR